MTKGEAAANLLEYLKGFEKRGTVWYESLDMAISALREQEERRRKSCPCKCVFDDSISGFYIGGKKYCPMCGRRLEEV